MSKPQKSVRQDYITKVRYLNNLPPPQLNPKFIKYNTTEKVSTATEADQLLTSLFRKENFHSLIEHVSEERGLPLNLIDVPGVLDGGDDSALFKLNKELPLHPRDRVLLRDAGIGKISKKEPEVSFLRRTEYISERAVRAAPEETNKESGAPEESYGPDAQLKAVENSFEVSQDSLRNFKDLKHPGKKHLKAVNAWPLLPDTSMMDSKFMSVKFNGSASISRELQALKRQKSDFDEASELLNLKTAIFKPITSADGEWISLYQNSSYANAASLYDKLNSTEKEKPLSVLDEVDEFEEFRFKHARNYDMEFKKFNPNQQELSIKFASENGKRKIAYSYPISGRIELKKHRASANSQINKFLKESTYDVIDLKVREPNTNEMRKMDNLRSEYDPMEYEGEEDEEEEEEQKPDEGAVEGERQDDEKVQEEEPVEEADSKATNGHLDIADEFDNEVGEN